MRVESSAGQCKSLDLSHGRTRYLEAGAGPAVILQRGVSYALGADAWRASIGDLASGLRVLAPDFPGWGPGDQLLPHAELRVFGGAGHNIPVERPAEFNRALLDFLHR